jgi:hypothetical protein
MLMNREDRVKDEDLSRDRRRFAAALGLFAAWVALLIGLGVKSGYRPMDRAGTVPSSVSTQEPTEAPE